MLNREQARKAIRLLHAHFDTMPDYNNKRKQWRQVKWWRRDPSKVKAAMKLLKSSGIEFDTATDPSGTPNTITLHVPHDVPVRLDGYKSRWEVPRTARYRIPPVKTCECCGRAL